MLIDAVALVLFVMALFKGLRKGLIVALFSFIAFVVGLAAALKLSALVADYLGSHFTVSHKWLPILAFALVFLTVALLVRLGARLLEGAVQLAMLGWLNRIGGVLFFLLIYLVVYSIILFYAESLHLLKPETIRSSVVFPYIRPLAPGMMHAIGAVIPWFKDTFADLLRFFQNLSDKSHPAQYSFHY